MNLETKINIVENILREIVFVKYQYDIMQRSMYELKMSYPDDIIDNINSSDKTTRLELQKSFLEMEYDRVTRSKFKSKEEIKFNLLSISSAIDEVKQNIKDEGKAQRYNQVIKKAEDMHYLSFLDSDIVKLRSVRNHIRKNPVNLTVICFKEQVAFLKSYLGESVKMRTYEIGEIMDTLECERRTGL